MLHLPHHDPSARYVSNPRPALDETVEVLVELPATGPDGRPMPISASWLRSVRDGEQFWVEGTPVDDGGRAEGHLLRFNLACTQAVMNYRFHLETDDGPRWLSAGGFLDHDPTDREDFRLLTTGGAPEWVPDVVWYQIFPDRFATTGEHRHDDHPTDTSWATWAAWDDPVADGPASMTQLYGGDLEGITRRLEHLVDLGVGGIYLTPVFPARSNHRYDATTFDHVDPVLGGDQALADLAAAAAEVGIRVMTDLTLNHTGDDHEWFVAAQADADGAEAAFYHFTDHPHGYESWLGVKSLPKLDHRSAELRRRYYEGPDSVFGRYLRPPFDMAGWRIDVANMTGRLGPLDLNQDVARAARATTDTVDALTPDSDDKWLVGEHFFDASLDAPGDGWHGVMNYAGLTRPIASWLGEFTALGAFMPGPGQAPRDGVQMARAMDAVRAATPWQVTMGSMSLLASHDTARWRTMCRSDEVARAGFGLLLSMPGAPTFFYGDEVGLTGDSSERARRTMPWPDDATAGPADGDGPTAGSGAASSAEGWDDDFLRWYRTMIAVRNGHVALRRGGFRWVDVKPDAVVFLRETADERLLVRTARAATEPVALDATLLRAHSARGVVDGEDLVAVEGVLRLPGDGPTHQIWALT
ncbi:MAG: glycoside hydrolase family 13 protein [Actinomycetota bacterium]